MELIELTYRERFHLSWHQMQQEPAEAVGYWLETEALRRKEEEKERRRHERTHGRHTT